VFSVVVVLGVLVGGDDVGGISVVVVVGVVGEVVFIEVLEEEVVGVGVLLGAVVFGVVFSQNVSPG
jgi:hypothetical protein